MRFGTVLGGPWGAKCRKGAVHFFAFLRKSKIFGAILGPGGFGGGGQNRVFGNHVEKNQEKGGPGAVPEKT